ncbi:hypothetical protein ANO11243_073020 [Dothideomycetidae sp. 11243]|nr:hypothetical protein ANO11243_073020 [fungal sp. No.11243]
MASPICLRCLARPSAGNAPSLAAHLRIAPVSASFSTTSALTSSVGKKIPKKKPASLAKPKKGSFVLARRGSRSSGSTASRKDPAAIRAQRKRVVLSNPNALSVTDMQELSVKNALSSEEGTILTLSNESIDALRSAEAFKHNQGWNLFRQPSTLVTNQAREVAALIEGINQDRNTHKEVVVGDKGAGKSVLALQAMAFALQAGWVVIHIPEAQELALAHTSYAPMRTSQGETLYTQPDYTAALLSRISKSNSAVLSKLSLSKSHAFPIPVANNISLARLADLGASDATIAPAIFAALMTELLLPSSAAHPRPPLLFSLDGLPHICRPSKYLDREAQPIHGFDLSLVNTFTSLLSGATPLPNGGLVQGIDTNSNRPTTRALDQHIQTALEKSTSSPFSKVQGITPFLSPYKGHDARVLEALRSVSVRHVQGVSRLEARGVMEYYARSGVMRGAVDEPRVAEAWTLAGGGVLGELEGSLTRLRV